MSERDDVEAILKENGDIYYVTRQTTTEDGLGRVDDVSEADFRIFGMIQDITIKDRQIQEMGLAVPGNRKIFLMPDYSITSAGVSVTTNEVKEGDILTDDKLYTGAGNTGQFRIVKILRQWEETDEEIYRTAIIQSINLDGS